MILVPVLTTSLIHFSLKGWENVLFELGSERVKMYTFSDFTLRYFELVRRRLLFVVHGEGKMNSGPVDLSSQHFSIAPWKTIKKNPTNELSISGQTIIIPQFRLISYLATISIRLHGKRYTASCMAKDVIFRRTTARKDANERESWAV